MENYEIKQVFRLRVVKLPFIFTLPCNIYNWSVTIHKVFFLSKRVVCLWAIDYLSNSIQQPLIHIYTCSKNFAASAHRKNTQ